MLKNDIMFTHCCDNWWMIKRQKIAWLHLNASLYLLSGWIGPTKDIKQNTNFPFGSLHIAWLKVAVSLWYEVWHSANVDIAALLDITQTKWPRRNYDCRNTCIHSRYYSVNYDMMLGSTGCDKARHNLRSCRLLLTYNTCDGDILGSRYYISIF